MSRNLLMVALTVLSVASASGAAANEIRYDNSPIVREERSTPAVRDFGLGENATQPGAGSVESAEHHLVKAGLWSSVKSAAKKVGSGVKTAAKAVGSGVKKVGKAIWNNTPVGALEGLKGLKSLKLLKKIVR